MNQPLSPLSQMLRSRGWILLFVLSLMFTTEFAVMLALPYVVPQPFSDGLEALIDAVLLSLVCAPVLWLVLTAAKRAEDERLVMARETEALRAQQMATLAQLATGVAHEIRNPLTSIKMLVQVNRDKFAAEGFLTEDLELIVQEIRRMERSIHGLLEYARPEAGEITIFPLYEPVRRTVQLIEGRCKAQNVHLITDAGDENLIIQGDATQIQQLLLNLCLNSLDAMPDGGELAIRAAIRDDLIEVSILDTGHGIAADMLDKLFTPFATSKPNGVGLGLGICRRIAQAHSGQLRGSNRDVAGAIFCLTLPRSSSLSMSSNALSPQDSNAAPASN